MSEFNTSNEEMGVCDICHMSYIIGMIGLCYHAWILGSVRREKDRMRGIILPL